MFRLGKRSFLEVINQIFSISIFYTIYNFFKYHKSPILELFNEFFSYGIYPRIIQIKKFKIKMYSVDDFSTLNLVFCRQDYVNFNNKRIVIDIGANIGTTTLYWLHNDPHCKVYCFEPSSLNFERLSYNLKKFNKSIILKKLGVDNKNYFKKLYLTKTGTNSSIFLKNKKKFEIIRVIDINSILNSLLKKYKYIDILKIDTEGTELSIIKSIKYNYIKKIKVINIEGKNYNKYLPNFFSFSFKGSASRFKNTKLL